MQSSTSTSHRSTGVIVTLVLVAVSTLSGCQNGASVRTVTSSTSTAQDSLAQESSSDDTLEPESSTTETAVSGSVPQGASPKAVAVLTAWNELGYCDGDWESNTADWRSVDDIPTPIEAWGCRSWSTDTLVGFARFADEAEVREYHTKAIAELERRGDLLITDAIKILTMGDGIIVGANDLALGSTDLAALEEIQARIGGEIVPILDLAD